MPTSLTHALTQSPFISLPIVAQMKVASWVSLRELKLEPLFGHGEPSVPMGGHLLPLLNSGDRPLFSLHAFKSFKKTAILPLLVLL